MEDDATRSEEPPEREAGTPGSAAGVSERRVAQQEGPAARVSDDRPPRRPRLGARLRRLGRIWRLYVLRTEIRLAPTEAQRLFLLTITIGAVCGLAAVAFHLSIAFVESRLIDRALDAPGHQWVAWTLLTPALGGLACGALLEFVVPNARGSGIPQVKAAFANPAAVVPLRDAIGKFFVGSLQIGSGASLGREGPTVQICAGIASWLGRVVGVSQKNQRRLLPVGVAAGIAAAFNAPIAAVTFTIEEVVGSLDQAVLSGVIVAAAFAAVIERSLLGESAVFEVQRTYGFHHASSLILYAGIGVSAAGAAIVFTESLLWLRARLKTVLGLPAWARPSLGGLVTGALAVLAVSVFDATGVTGGGYATLGHVLNGEVAWRVLLALSAMKLVATVFSYSSGGAGGIFAPTLFIGGTLGGAIGTLDATWFHRSDESVGAFALVGMGAVFAGVIRAPITSVLIIIEMTGGYSLILPLMIANMTAYVLARRYRPQSIYEALLEQDGVKLGPPAAESSEVPRVRSVLSGEPALTLTRSTPALQIRALCQAPRRQRTYPVLDAVGRLLGVVTPEELAILEASPELLPVTTASDLMRTAVPVRADDDISTAIEKMLANGLRELPVTDSGGCLLGMIDDKDVAKAYQPRRASPKPAP
jgi:CIC family chloride channel protein